MHSGGVEAVAICLGVDQACVIGAFRLTRHDQKYKCSSKFRSQADICRRVPSRGNHVQVPEISRRSNGLKSVNGDGKSFLQSRWPAQHCGTLLTKTHIRRLEDIPCPGASFKGGLEALDWDQPAEMMPLSRCLLLAHLQIWWNTRHAKHFRPIASLLCLRRALSEEVVCKIKLSEASAL